MCVYVVCLVNVQAEQSELSRNSWSSKISLESANGCKIYSTLACAASGSVKNRKKKKKKAGSFQKRALKWLQQCLWRCACVYAQLCYLSRDPLLFLVVPPMISSSCQCMYFLDRPWQPPVRTRATSKGWHKEKKELSSYFQTWHITTAH